MGLPVITPPTSARSRRRWAHVYLAAVGVLVASLLALVAVDWGGLEVGARVAFSGLAVLGGVMMYRLLRAGREATARRPGWRARYVDHVYFTYVSLWIGLAILPALRSDRPELLVPVAVAGVLGAGHLLIHAYTRRLGLVER